MSAGKIAVFGLAAAAVVGGAIYFVKVKSEKGGKGAAREELAAWDAKWEDVRKCLIGDKPASSKLAEAMAIRRLEAKEKLNCAGAAGKLTRPEGEPGSESVEGAWDRLERAANDLAVAFINDAKPLAARKAGVPSMAVAFERIVEARNQLGTELGAEPLPAQLTGDALPKVTLVEIESKERYLTQFPPSAAGAIYPGDGERLVLATGAEPARFDNKRAIPGLWAAESDKTGIKIAAFDKGGGRTNETVVKMQNVLGVSAAIGAPEQGLVVAVLGDDKGATGFTILRGKVGAFTPDPVIKADGVFTWYDPVGRTVLAWHDEAAKKTRVLLLQAGQPDRTLDIGDTPSSMIKRMCFTRDRVWVQGGGELVGMSMAATAAPTVRHPSTHELMGCTAEAVLATSAKELQVCSTTCRTLTKRTAAGGTDALAAFTVVGDKVVAITADGPILRVVREGGKTTFFATPEPIEMASGIAAAAMPTSDGKVIDLFASTAKGQVIVRLPAPT